MVRGAQAPAAGGVHGRGPARRPAAEGARRLRQAAPEIVFIAIIVFLFKKKITKTKKMEKPNLTTKKKKERKVL